MRFLTVVGHVNVDIILDVPGIPAFGSEEIRGIRRVLGGTGANIARFAAALGTPVQLVSRVSKRFPEDLLSALRQERIELTLELDDDEGPICYIIDSKERQTAFMYQGPMKKPGKIFNVESEYCHFATSNPDWILSLMNRCAGTKVLDPGQEARYRWDQGKLKEAVQKADLLIVNEDEFHYISSFMEIDPQKAIVTLGGRGAAYGGEVFGTEYIPNVSTVGAGDMFRAALYSSLYRGNDLRESIRVANRITSFYLRNGMNIATKYDWGEG
ncbi:MAG: PfkB family carbohydrate kinase [Thermoplasmata archaeon]